MGITHYNMGVQAFKKVHGRPPKQTNDLRQPDEAWIQKWKADHVAQKVRQDPAYARYHAIYGVGAPLTPRAARHGLEERAAFLSRSRMRRLSCRVVLICASRQRSRHVLERLRA